MEKEVADFKIIIAEDDADDRLLIQQAFEENKIPHKIIFVCDGEELVNYLCGSSADLVILDLNMPKKDGREALREIRNDGKLPKLPIVVLTTSEDAEDISDCYFYGANSFITKPPTFSELTAMVKSLEKYWCGIVKLPTRADLNGKSPTHYNIRSSPHTR